MRIKTPFKLDENMQRIDDTPAHVAIREAMVNAIIHADYGGRMGIVVTLWRDHYEFRNPGLMRMTTAKAFKGANSDCRNRTLQKFFQFLGHSEKAGSGFQRIFMGTDEQHWARPTISEDFELDQTYLTVPCVDLSAVDHTAPGMKTGMKDTESTLKSTLKSTLNKTDARIVELLLDNASVTISDLVADLKLTREAINKAIKRLKDAEVIRRVGPDRGGYWEVVK